VRGFGPRGPRKCAKGAKVARRDEAFGTNGGWDRDDCRLSGLVAGILEPRLSASARAGCGGDAGYWK
jgi:hypothetical protein